jgi:hypothetical protein
VKYIIFMITLFATIITAQEPDWYTADYSKKYPSAFYFVGMGSNQDADAAIQLAQNQIASQIRVNINSESNLNLSETSQNGEYNVKEKYDRNINSYIEETLTGVEIVRKEKEGDYYYVLATLRKDKFLEEIESKLDQLKTNINSYIKTSNENLQNGDIQNTLKFLLKAKDELVDYNASKAFYNALSNIPYDMEGATDTFAKVESDIAKISSSISIEVAEGDGQKVEVGMELSPPLKYFVSVKLDTGVIPLKHVPLLVFNQASDVIDRLETNEEGIIVIKSIPFSSSKNVEKISAKINSSKIDDDVRGLIKPAPAEANITTYLRTVNSFDLDITDQYNKHVKEIESKVGRILTQNGQIVGGQTDYIISGKIDDFVSSEVNSFKGKMTTVKFSTDLELKKKSSGEKLGFIKISGTGLGKDKKEAISKALRSVNIKTEDILKLISEL